MIEYQYIVDYFKEAPFFIQLALTVIVILTIAIVVLTIYLKTVRSLLRTKDKDILKFKKEYEALLIEYLYSGNEKEVLSEKQHAIILKLKQEIQVKARRVSVVSILKNLMNEVSGEMTDAIKTLYCKTGLIDYALFRLENKNWHIITKAIGELTRFRIDEAHDLVVTFINHPRPEVRKEAQLYLVNLFRFKGLSFLNTLALPLSEWHQLQLLESLLNFDDQEIDNIKPWLRSTNASVVLFALKLSKIYSQFEVKDVLIELLSHAEEEVRVSAIDVLTQLFGYEVKELLKAHFDKLHSDEQMHFFQRLEESAEPIDGPFIEQHLFHVNFEIQVLALKILNSISMIKFTSSNTLLLELKTKEIFKSNIDI